MRASRSVLLGFALLPVLLAACRSGLPAEVPEPAADDEPSVYATVRQTPLYALLFNPPPTPPTDAGDTRTAIDLAAIPYARSMDSLHTQLAGLRTRFSALQQSNATFLQALREQGGGPLRELASSERTTERLRELVWQLRQHIDLLGDTQALLARSNAYFLRSLEAAPASADSLRQAGERMRLEIARLGDISVVLGRTRDRLGAPGEPLLVDSLRQAGQRIRLEITRQGIVLAMLRRNAPLLSSLTQQDSSAVLHELGDQMQAGVTQAGDVHAALRAANTQLLDTLGGNLTRYGWRLILALVVGVAGLLAVRSLVWLLETLAERQAARRLFYKKLIPIARLTVWGLTIYVILTEIFRLDQRGLLAAATALGVAIGFAAQDILKNIFGGILIIFDQPFQVGDKINVEGTYGEVVSIGLRSTRIVTPDDNLVSVPNSQVVDSQVANANAGALDCQVVVDLFLPGWVDVMKAKAIAYSAAANSQYVYLGKPIVVNVKDVFKETFLTQLKVKAYVLDTRYEFAFASNVTETAKAEFMRQGMLGPASDVRASLEPTNGSSPSSSPSDAS